MSESKIESKDNKKPKKFTSYAEALESFKEFHSNIRGQLRLKLITLIEALKAEGKTEEEAKEQLRKDLQGLVSRPYIIIVTKEQYRSKEEILADAEKLNKLNEEEKAKKQEATLPQLVLSVSTGGQEVIDVMKHGEDDDPTLKNKKTQSLEPPKSIQERREERDPDRYSVKGKAANEMRGASKESATITQDPEFTNAPDDATEQKQDPNYDTITISEPQLIQKINNLTSRGLELVITINKRKEVIDVNGGQVVA